MNIQLNYVKNIDFKSIYKQLLIFQLALLCGYSSAAVNTSVSVSDFTKVPAGISQSVTPKVMLAMSNDHQLYFKLYTDWDDLDGDGVQDTTYKNSIDYYGYFDSYKCYNYDTTDGRFEPIDTTADKYCTGSLSTYFSGNFLNWASMTRMDAIRKVLYGGFRSTDSATETVLERSFLPTDAHSFAKYYDGADIKDLTPWDESEITLCNTTYTSSGGHEPLLRIVGDDYRYWAANERWQCTWDDEDTSADGSGPNTTGSETWYPDKTSVGLGNSDYIVRVQVCDSSKLGKEKCKTYDGTNYKPIGLLQSYGDSEAIDFGLITGSYEKNKSGGVVRKEISSFTDEINSTTGIFTGISGIISTLNKFRIANYNHSDGRYNVTDNCPWKQSVFSEGSCSNWGNPFSEIYLEAVRYFAGLTKNTNFDADDTGYINGLTDVTSWTDPLSADTRCASCNIVVINASDISYDHESLSMTGLPGSPSAVTLTNMLGVIEGISGNDYYVGESGAATDQLCTPKTVAHLGEVKGTCPNAPRLEGTYNIAGIAYWAHTEDIRTDLSDIQDIDTYAIALAPSTPSIIIPINNSDRTVTILPACRNATLTPEGNCAIVDFKILSQNVNAGTGVLYINWEDNEQGGDFDQDMKGILEYKISNTTIEISTNVNAKSTPFALGFGYIIGGTTDDGFHVHSGINGFTYDGCNNCNVGDAATKEEYTLGTSSASLLEDPLWYTAKYGGFKDIDDDFDPNETNDTTEWDSLNLEGKYVKDGDGYPDNYFPVFNPGNLEDRMNQVFTAIINKVSAGSAAAVVSKTSTGIGAIYQAIYQPLLKQGLDEATWAGFIHGIFIDSKGLLREDTDRDGLLDGYATDQIIEVFFNEVDEETQIQRYTSSDGVTLVADGPPVPLHSIKPIWSAQETMSPLTNSSIKSNRTYDPTATTNGRFMYTWIDDPGSASSTGTVGVIDNGEIVPFIASTFDATSNNYRYLNHATPADNLDDGDDAGDIVNFVRGVTNITGQRNREIDYDDDGDTEKLRIGDIVHSTPVAVGTPHDGYDTIYHDDTYRDFITHYANRRQVVYVGGNDGVIHAFNGGFWDDAQTGFVTDLDDNMIGLPLGAELWGYVPMNLLPHLKWLPEVDYPHVFYMDGEPLVFDANIFSEDPDHPHGWGTVLVIGMRLGGGEIALDINDDGTFGGTEDITTRSAYVVMDITNPEEPPTVIAEITDEDLNFTMGLPDVIRFRKPDSDGSGDYDDTNEWYLAFGSGPDDISNVESTETARVYLWDLEARTFVSGFDGTANGAAIGFMGDFTTMDWDLDGMDDTVYFGTDETDTARLSPSGGLGGRLQRLILDSDTITNSSISTVINPDQVMINKPLAVREARNRWIFAGTGRLLSTGDAKTNDQESFYGIMEDKADPDETYTRSDLQNVTGVDVYTAGYIIDNDGVLSGEPVSSDNDYNTGYRWLEKEVASQDGWYLNMATDNPAARNLGNAVNINALLAYTVYTPTADSCDDINGSTNLRVSCLKTGTACSFKVFPEDIDNNNDKSLAETHFTDGLATDISIHIDGKGNPQFIGHGQHGNIQRQSFILPPLIFGRKSWREIIDY